MADGRLSVRDRELFLAEPHIAALSVSAGPDRGPVTVPIWYQYEPGGEAWVLTEAASRKARLIEAAGRTGAFWIYGAIGVLTLWFCWKFVPETKGKRLEDIQAYFQERVESRKASA